MKSGSRKKSGSRRWSLRALAALSALVAFVLGIASCDDPVPGPIGGVVLVIRTFPSEAGSKLADVEKITIEYNKVVAVHRDDASSEDEQTVLDTQPRTIVLTNTSADVLVGQFQTPVGLLEQIRIFPTSVVIHLQGGTDVSLDPATSDLPSMRNTGWKIVPEDGNPFTVVLDELSGVRGLFHFDERLVRPGNAKDGNGKGKGGKSGFKLKPTLPAEAFDPNPAKGAPGVLIDHVTFVAKPGLTPAQVEAVATAVQASVARFPHGSRWYRFKLPVTMNLEQAIIYFSAQPEAEVVLPAVNLGLDQVTPNDDGQTNVDIANIDFGWEQAQNQDPNGLIGSHVVRAAVAEGPVDVLHPDLRRNIAIHQGELPLSLFDTDADNAISAAEIAAHDCDPPGAPDGVISIRDMECDAAIAPPDANGNAVIDGQDVIGDTGGCATGCWADGTDADGNGFVDDLIGWDFIGDDNDPTLAMGSVASWHATFVAGIIGAEGNNGMGIAGLNWRASIVGLRTGLRSATAEFAPHEALADAFTYSENPLNRIDVWNMSMGYIFEHEDADRGCGTKNGQNVTSGIGDQIFDDGVAAWNTAFAGLFTNAGHTLYVLSAGNSGTDITDGGIFRVPFKPMRDNALVADRVLPVGAAETATTKAEFSVYGAGVEVYAPGVAWRSLIPAQFTCRADAAGLADAPCSVDPCPQEGSTVACVSDGTSFSAPTVAGAAALLAAVDPTFRYNGEGLRQAILDASAAVPFEDCDGDGVGARLLDVNVLLAP